MLWQRSEPLKPPHELPPSIPGSDLVRQAALQASWQRDRRVAQRRIAWRWTVWYVQRFSPHVLVGVTALAGVAYLTGSLPSWSDRGAGPERPAPSVAPAPYSPPSVPTTALVNAPSVEQAAAPATDLPLTLRASLALGAALATPAPAPAAPNSPDTLTLKPENWLHSKEP